MQSLTACPDEEASIHDFDADTGWIGITQLTTYPRCSPVITSVIPMSGNNAENERQSGCKPADAGCIVCRKPCNQCRDRSPVNVHPGYTTATSLEK